MKHHSKTLRIQFIWEKVSDMDIAERFKVQSGGNFDDVDTLNGNIKEVLPSEAEEV